MSLHERIREARKRAGMTQAALAKAVKVAPSTLAGWEKNMEPSAAQIGLVALATGVSVNFLFQDEMQEPVDPIVSQKEMKMVRQYRDLDDYGRDAVDGVLSVEFRRCQETRRKTPLYDFGIYDLPSAAGSGIPVEDAELYTVLLKEPPPRGSFGVKVNGQSMEPTYMDGDIVFVRHATDVPLGKVGIFTVNGITYIKRAGKNRLISDNDDYDDIYPDPEEGARIQGLVLGKVDPSIIVE